MRAAIRELSEETGLTANEPRPLCGPYKAHGDELQAFICTCKDVSKLGKSSSFSGGLPVSPELGFPENDAWRWCTGTRRNEDRISWIRVRTNSERKEMRDRPTL